MARARERNGGQPRRWGYQFANSQRFEPRGIHIAASLVCGLRRPVCDNSVPARHPPAKKPSAGQAKG